MLEKQVKIAFLSVGSNLGNKKKNIEKAKVLLNKNKIKIIKSSKNYETFSWPNKKNPKFINIVLKVKTILSPNKLLNKCLYIEKTLGRIRKKKNEPRICDIDIIDYNGEVLHAYNNEILTLPHPEMHKRNFVLVPLFEISKSWVHPLKKARIVNLLNSLKDKDLRAIKLI